MYELTQKRNLLAPGDALLSFEKDPIQMDRQLLYQQQDTIDQSFPYSRHQQWPKLLLFRLLPTLRVPHRYRIPRRRSLHLGLMIGFQSLEIEANLANWCAAF